MEHAKLYMTEQQYQELLQRFGIEVKNGCISTREAFIKIALINAFAMGRDAVKQVLFDGEDWEL